MKATKGYKEQASEHTQKMFFLSQQHHNVMEQYKTPVTYYVIGEDKTSDKKICTGAKQRNLLHDVMV